MLESIEYSDVIFLQYSKDYVEDICPIDGEVRYIDGKDECSLHPRDGELEDHDDEDEGLPFFDGE